MERTEGFSYGWKGIVGTPDIPSEKQLNENDYSFEKNTKKERKRKISTAQEIPTAVQLLKKDLLARNVEHCTLGFRNRPPPRRRFGWRAGHCIWGREQNRSAVQGGTSEALLDGMTDLYPSYYGTVAFSWIFGF